MNPEISPLLTAECAVDIYNEIYVMAVKALEQAERIAETTDSLRAIAEAASLRKSLRELVSDRQAYLSKQFLVKEGVWDEVFADKVAYNISVITGQTPNPQERI